MVFDTGKVGRQVLGERQQGRGEGQGRAHGDQRDREGQAMQLTKYLQFQKISPRRKKKKSYKFGERKENVENVLKLKKFIDARRRKKNDKKIVRKVTIYEKKIWVRKTRERKRSKIKKSERK